jgi:phosphoribosylformimino-5-aminoimidazole carboxamide ribotide isomerase
MLVIPAIDLKDGRCVRLRQGKFDDVTVFSDDPLVVAERWLDAGCRRLHLVDLDGAVAGAPRNDGLVRRICAAAGAVPIQVGGGIRDHATIAAYLDAGISQVIIGTRAVVDPAFLADACSTYPDRVILGLDARDGLLATNGWEATTTIRAVDFAREAAAHPLHAIVYTDIARDGMLSGLNVAATVDLAEAAGIPVIASGGIRNLEDLAELDQAARSGGGVVLGAISGRALYEGTLEFQAAQALLDA